MGNLTFFADVHEGIPRLALRPNADGQAADHGISMGSCVWGLPLPWLYGLHTSSLGAKLQLEGHPLKIMIKHSEYLERRLEDNDEMTSAQLWRLIPLDRIQSYD